MPRLKSNIGNRSFISLDDVCELLSITTIKDDIGNMIKTEKPFMCFCSKMSITRAEFNAAGSLGLKPDMMLVVDGDAYDNEKYLLYQGTKYSIYKSYQRADNFMELYCEVRNGD